MDAEIVKMKLIGALNKLAQDLKEVMFAIEEQDKDLLLPFGSGISETEPKILHYLTKVDHATIPEIQLEIEEAITTTEFYVGTLCDSEGLSVTYADAIVLYKGLAEAYVKAKQIEKAKNLYNTAIALAEAQSSSDLPDLKKSLAEL